MSKFHKDVISIFACVILGGCSLIAGLAGLSSAAGIFLAGAAAIAILSV